MRVRQYVWLDEPYGEIGPLRIAKRYNTILQYRSSQRCTAIFPASGMKHSQDDPRRSLRPPDGGRDDLIGEVMRMLRLRSAQAKSKQNLSRLAG